MVYSNAFDHLYSLDAVMAEVSRILRPTGTLVLDIVLGNKEGFFPGNTDSYHWETTEALIARIEASVSNHFPPPLARGVLVAGRIQ